MDTNYYALGTEAECVVCQREKAGAAARAQKADDEFQNALATFLLADTGRERKKAVVDVFSGA